MFLFIGESLGLQELIFIGIFALIIFGPRKLPQMARKFGKIMAELKKVTGEFKSTWEKEVDFESFEDDEPKRKSETIENTISKNSAIEPQEIVAPEIKELEAVDFKEVISQDSSDNGLKKEEVSIKITAEESQTNKRDWL